MTRALVGAFVGAMLGTVLWLGLETVSGRSLEWLVLLVGGLAGFGVRILCKQRSSTTGIIATSMALIGIVGGNLVQPLILQQIYDATAKPLPSSVNKKDAGRPEEDAASDDAASDDATSDDATSDDSATDETATGDQQDFLTTMMFPFDSAGSGSAALALRTSAPDYLGQATGVGQSNASQILELAMYVISAILAYVLGAGSKASSSATRPGAPTEATS